jgi:hypothetical protein
MQVSYSNFLQLTDKKSFPPFPYPELKNWKPDARIAWRQAVRVKEGNGFLIEDYGIETDFVVQPTLNDLLDIANSTTVYDIIADRLNFFSNILGKVDLNFKATPELQADYLIGSPIEMTLETSGIQTVVVLSSQGQKLIQQDATNVTELTRRPLSFKFDAPRPGIYRFQLQGYDRRGQSVFTTFRNFRIIPGVRRPISSGTTQLDFVGNYTGVFDVRTRLGDGWNRNATSLRIGNGTQYKGNVDSMMSWFLLPPDGTMQLQVHLVAEYDTEAGYDFLSFGYADQFGVYQLLLGRDAEGGEVDAVSGKGLIDETFLINYEGNPELFIRFVSDPQTNGSGVNVKRLEVICE